MARAEPEAEMIAYVSVHTVVAGTSPQKSKSFDFCEWTRKPLSYGRSHNKFAAVDHQL